MVLITDDEECRTKAAKLNLNVCTILDYVKSLTIDNTIEEKLSKRNVSFVDENKNLFPNHLSTSDIHAGLKNSSLIQGTFQASRYNYLEGFVLIGQENSEKVCLC